MCTQVVILDFSENAIGKIMDFYMRHLRIILIKLLFSTTAVIGVVLIMTSCADVVEPIVYAKRGGISPSTEDKIFEPSINEDIRRELSGNTPLGQPNWRAYWRMRYSQIRAVISRGSPDAQRFIDYIHQQRAVAGLPLYDDVVPPSKRI